MVYPITFQLHRFYALQLMACFTCSIEDHERLWCLYIPELLRRKAFEEVPVTPIVLLGLAFMILVIVVILSTSFNQSGVRMVMDL